MPEFWPEESPHGNTDRYGRTVGDVLLPNGKRLNAELVSAGMAWWYREYARDDTSLMRRHLDANTRRIGLWSDPAPIAPWDFRKNPSSRPSAAQPRPNVRPDVQSTDPIRQTYRRNVVSAAF